MPIGNAGSLRDAATPQLASTCQPLVQYPFECRVHFYTKTPRSPAAIQGIRQLPLSYDARAVSANTC